MNIIIDKYIPFLQGILEPYAEVRYLEPEEFTAEVVKWADALLVRTRTKCNEALLAGSKVQLIATATIGFDHIDTHYCEQNGIVWTNSAGCNAQGVCDYIEEALNTLFSSLSGLTLGVVGVGHVGSKVAKMAASYGMRVLVNDPPKWQVGNNNEYGQVVSLSDIAEQADIITFHTPLVRKGEFATYHLYGEEFLSKCKDNAVIINAARGGIVDEKALIKHLTATSKKAVIDTWEGEPNINTDLLGLATLGSFHIAGYSLQGKINASNMCLSALCKHFCLPALQIDEKTLPLHGDSDKGWIRRVDSQFREAPERFEVLRETYRLR